MREDKLVNQLSYPLVLDVSSPTVQTGIALSSGWDKLTSSQNQPMDGLFQCIEQLNIDLNKIDSLFFCAGPGSTLGLRLALAFVKTVQWKIGSKIKLFSYNALDLACKMTDAPPLFVQAPFRMGWRLVRSSPDKQAIGKKKIFESEEALEKFPDSVHLPNTRSKDHPLASGEMLDYNLNKIRGLTDLLPVSELVIEPKIYSPRPPEFKKWNPKIKFLSPD